MPRNKSGSSKRRKRLESDALDARLGVDDSPGDAIHLRIDVDSLEFADLFTVQGGRKKIGPGITSEKVVIRAFNLNGQKPGKAVAPHVLSLDRGKVAMQMAKARDAEAILAAKLKLREENKQKQIGALLQAHQGNLIRWERQDVPDQQYRSVLVGSNKGGQDPTLESDSLVICFRQECGRYALAVETWSGFWTTNGERADVRIDILADDFADEQHAQATVLYCLHRGELDGELSRLNDRRDYRYMQRFAARLRQWEHNGHDMHLIHDVEPPHRRESTRRKRDEHDDFLDRVRIEASVPLREQVTRSGKWMRINK